MRIILIFMASFIAFTSCTPPETKEVNVYTHRHYDVDQALFNAFTKKTGIAVNVIKASADELLVKLEQEGENSPADLLVTVDVSRLEKAKEKGLLQNISSTILQKNIPLELRDSAGSWFAQTIRGRVVVYNKETVSSEQLSTYEALTDQQWENKLLVRSSSNMYNQSLMASIIANNGSDSALAWAKGVVANMARDPKGNDRDQVKAIAAGEGDLAIINTYYLGKLLTSDNPEEVKAGEAVGIFFPNQDGRGAHINISGAGVTKYAPNKQNAVLLLEFLSEKEAQEKFAAANHEYPVNPTVAPTPILSSWGTFKADTKSLKEIYAFQAEAILLFDQAGWK
ncbi:MAG: iron(III) transport system substrate-binding protein [Flavobacteriales bacterium]|jgi:iron(III) transport system substrate-binding protein